MGGLSHTASAYSPFLSGQKDKQTGSFSCNASEGCFHIFLWQTIIVMLSSKYITWNLLEVSAGLPEGAQNIFLTGEYMC